MKEMIPVLLLFFGMTAACWFLIINRRLRMKIQRRSWRIYKLNEEQKEMNDALYLAGFLVAAIAFTIAFVVACVLAILSNS